MFSHGQYYVGLSRAGSFEAVKVLVVDHDKQGLYEDNEGIPDGVYTDNVVWKEALLRREGDATCSSAASSAHTMPPTASAAVHQTSPVAALTDVVGSPAEALT